MYIGGVYYSVIIFMIVESLYNGTQERLKDITRKKLLEEVFSLRTERSEKNKPEKLEWDRIGYSRWEKKHDLRSRYVYSWVQVK